MPELIVGIISTMLPPIETFAFYGGNTIKKWNNPMTVYYRRKYLRYKIYYIIRLWRKTVHIELGQAK